MAGPPVYERAIIEAVDRMDRAGLSLERSADELLRAGVDLVAQCAGEDAARRWLRQQLKHLEREDRERPARFFTTVESNDHE